MSTLLSFIKTHRPGIKLLFQPTKPCLYWSPVGKFRGNVSNNAKRSEIGSWSLLYTSTATLIIPSLLWAILAKNLKLNPAASVALDLLSGCTWTFWTPPLIIAVAFQPLLLIMKDFGSRFNFTLCGDRAYT
ncbi:hypothetical protein CDAR_118781 [Caerostris darwini]|uniref:Uncharacterized protein n=1 Tax=Caerostris darwini TaxID=1538125 RepID=A0AAV4TPM0_9ARAC|nr:hypothetical protein CDAR_118781 [Caerostris darwini]